MQYQEIPFSDASLAPFITLLPSFLIVFGNTSKMTKKLTGMEFQGHGFDGKLRLAVTHLGSKDASEYGAICPKMRQSTVDCASAIQIFLAGSAFLFR